MSAAISCLSPPPRSSPQTLDDPGPIVSLVRFVSDEAISVLRVKILLGEPQYVDLSLTPLDRGRTPVGSGPILRLNDLPVDRFVPAADVRRGLIREAAAALDFEDGFAGDFDAPLAPLTSKSVRHLGLSIARDHDATPDETLYLEFRSSVLRTGEPLLLITRGEAERRIAAAAERLRTLGRTGPAADDALHGLYFDLISGADAAPLTTNAKVSR